MKPSILIALAFIGCAHPLPRQAPSASTRGLSSTLGKAQGNVAGAATSNERAAGSVARARAISDRIDAKSVVILKYLGK